MADIDLSLPQKVLTALAGSVDDFYLTGGTALSLVYYQHRASHDVDLFTQAFAPERVIRAADDLKKACGAEIEIMGEQLSTNMARMIIYKVVFKDGSVCKVDFVEDFFDLLKPVRNIDGINVLSLEDIYLRKIFAVNGYMSTHSITGQKIMTGGRQEAKDFYDMYCLSNMSIPLSDFVFKYGDPAMREGLVRWHRTYDRMLMKTGLLDLITGKKIDSRDIENHFDREIKTILVKETGI